jgi:hypothetical protein
LARGGSDEQLRLESSCFAPGGSRPSSRRSDRLSEFKNLGAFAAPRGDCSLPLSVEHFDGPLLGHSPEKWLRNACEFAGEHRLF